MLHCDNLYTRVSFAKPPLPSRTRWNDVLKLISEILCISLSVNWVKYVYCTGKSLSEALIFASTNPQYDNRLFIELQVHYIHENSKLKPEENMLCTEIVSDIQNNFCTQHVLQKEELLTNIYLFQDHWLDNGYVTHIY